MFLNIMIFVILPILVVALIVLKVDSYFKGKVIKESKMQQLEFGKKYTIVYKQFFKKYIFSIEPRQDHNTIITENTQYNGRLDTYVQVKAAGYIIYSAYLKNVVDIISDDL